MQTGGQSDTVTVEAATPLLQADNSTVSSTITAVSVQDLPLNGRNYVQLVQLVPGANEGPGNGLTSGGRPDDRRPTSSFSVNGQDDTLNNTTVDGIDDNERHHRHHRHQARRRRHPGDHRPDQQLRGRSRTHRRWSRLHHHPLRNQPASWHCLRVLPQRYLRLQECSTDHGPQAGASSKPVRRVHRRSHLQRPDLLLR